MEHKGFTDLEAWKKSRIFRNKCFELCNSFPESEKYNLRNQLLRASRFITANITERQGRFHFKENIQFCRIARGSFTECLDHLICAFDCGYLSKEKLSELKIEID